MHVPAEACAGLSDTLRAEVMGENSLKVRMRHGRLPSEFGASTAKARAVGNHMYNIAAGPGQPQPLKPGVWFIRVENTRLSSVSYRICAKLFQDVDKLAYNPALVGCDVGTSTVVEAEGDEWEMVDRLSVTEAMIPRVMHGNTALAAVSNQDAAAVRTATALGDLTLADGSAVQMYFGLDGDRLDDLTQAVGESQSKTPFTFIRF